MADVDTSQLPRFAQPGVPPAGLLATSAPAPVPAPPGLLATYAGAAGKDLSGAVQNFRRGEVLPGLGAGVRGLVEVPGSAAATVGLAGQLAGGALLDRVVSPVVSGFLHPGDTPTQAAPAPQLPAVAPAVPTTTPAQIAPIAAPAASAPVKPVAMAAPPATMAQQPVRVIAGGHDRSAGRNMSLQEAQMILGATAPRMTAEEQARTANLNISHLSLEKNLQGVEDSLASGKITPAQAAAAKIQHVSDYVKDLRVIYGQDQLRALEALQLAKQQQTQGMP